MLESVTMPAAALDMTGSRPIEWKELKSAGGLLSVYRAKVPGGWLVYASNGYYHHGGITFYPDPGHLWTGESLP